MKNTYDRIDQELTSTRWLLLVLMSRLIASIIGVHQLNNDPLTWRDTWLTAWPNVTRTLELLQATAGHTPPSLCCSGDSLPQARSSHAPAHHPPPNFPDLRRTHLASSRISLPNEGICCWRFLSEQMLNSFSNVRRIWFKAGQIKSSQGWAERYWWVYDVWSSERSDKLPLQGLPPRSWNW